MSATALAFDHQEVSEAERLGLDPKEYERYKAVLSSVASVPEIMARPLPDVQQLLGPLVVRGQTTVIGAAKGHGKTSMTLQMVRSILFGEEFLDWTGAGDTRALIVDAEQGELTVARRLKEAGLEDVPGDILKHSRHPTGLTLDSSLGERRAMERIFAEGEFDVVVFDPLYMIHGGDSNAERDAADTMKILRGWQEEYGFALIVCTHVRKADSSTHYRLTMDDFFGSTAWLRPIEIVMGLQKKKYGYTKLYCFSDRSGDLLELFQDEPWGLKFTREDGFSRGDIPDGRRDKSEQSRQRVAQAMIDHPGSTEQQLIDLTGLGKSTVRKAIQELNPRREERPYRHYLDQAAA